MKIELQEKCSAIKPNWFEWSALAIMPDGKIVEGLVQADGSGDMIAEETFWPNEE